MDGFGKIKQLCTLESGGDVGQGISLGPGNFGKNIKHRALNKRRACKQNVQTCDETSPKKLENIRSSWKKLQYLIKSRAYVYSGL